MQTSVETVSEVEVKVTVEIPADVVDRELGNEIRRIRRKAHIHGFRPGKAPADLIKRLYAVQLFEDTSRKLVSDTLDEAFESITSTRLGDPSIEPEPLLEGHPLRYMVRVQVKPKITLTDWRGVEVSMPPATFDPAAIDARIADLQMQQAERVPVEGRGADIGDILIVYTASVPNDEDQDEQEYDEDHQDEQEYHEDRFYGYDIELKLGADRILDGLTDGLLGVRAGETRDVVVHIDEDEDDEDLRGTEKTIRVRVTQHFIEDVPELDNELATDLGYQSMEDMRAKVADHLQNAAQRARKNEIGSRVLDVLIERHPFQVPPVMLEEWFNHCVRRTLLRLKARGVRGHQALEDVRQHLDQISLETERDLKRFLLSEALAEQEGITIGDAMIEIERTGSAEQGYANAAEGQNDEQRREAERAALRDLAVLDLLAASAKVTNAVEMSGESAEAIEDTERVAAGGTAKPSQKATKPPPKAAESSCKVAEGTGATAAQEGASKASEPGPSSQAERTGAADTATEAAS